MAVRGLAAAQHHAPAAGALAMLAPPPLSVRVVRTNGEAPESPQELMGDRMAKPGAEVVALEAQQGERMIEVKVRFWTNDIAKGGKGIVRPKHAWASGVVRMERNKTHGITPGSPRPFHSLLDLPAAIEKALMEHGVVLHLNRRMKKYFHVK